MNPDMPAMPLDKNDSFAEWFDEEMLSDVTFTLGDGTQICANKYIIAHSSKVFANLFEHQINHIKLMEESNSEVFAELIKYFYTGQVSTMEQFAPQLLAMADKVCVCLNDTIFWSHSKPISVQDKHSQDTMRTLSMFSTINWLCHGFS